VEDCCSWEVCYAARSAVVGGSSAVAGRIVVAYWGV
jgi:hypothetical protein